MTKRIVVGSLLFVSLVCILMIAEAGPRIDFAVKEHDFGEVTHGESPSAPLACKNIGDEELVLEKIESSCGCAKTVRGNTRIAPGSSSEIIAGIDTYGMRPGRQSKSIDVYSNDPEHPRVRLKLKFNVVRHVTLDPHVLAMCLKECDKDAVFSLEATNHWSKPIVLRVAKSSASDEAVLIPEEVVVPPAAKTGFQLAIRIKPGAVQSHVKGVVPIETDDPVEKTLPIHYFIQLPKTGNVSPRN